MDIVIQSKGAVGKARLAGELDHHAAEKTRDKLDELIDGGAKTIELDLGGLTFMDSSGIGVIIGRYKRLKKNGGKLVVTKSNERVDRIMRMAGLFGIVSRT